MSFNLLQILSSSLLIMCPHSQPQLCLSTPLPSAMTRCSELVFVHFCSASGPASSPGSADSVHCYWLDVCIFLKLTDILYGSILMLLYVSNVILKVYPWPHQSMSPPLFKDAKNRGSPRQQYNDLFDFAYNPHTTILEYNSDTSTTDSL